MNKILTLLAVSIISASIFTGCQKFDYNPSMVANIGSDKFSGSTKANVYAQVDTSTHSPQIVIVTGMSDVYTPGTSFRPIISLALPHAIGKYTIDTTNNIRRTMVYTSATGSTGTVAVSGEINFLSDDSRKIKGNFTLTCADGTTITNGQFVAEENYY